MFDPNKPEESIILIPDGAYDNLYVVKITSILLISTTEIPLITMLIIKKKN